MHSRSAPHPLRATSSVRPLRQPLPRASVASPERTGFTLAELVVAIVLLTVGVGSLASTAAYVIYETAASRRAELAAHLARTRFDLLRIGACAPQSGAIVHGSLTERWELSVASGGAYASIVIAWEERGQGVVHRYRTAIAC